MRHFFLFVTAVTLLLTVSPAHAQPNLRVSSGAAVPLSPHLFTSASAPGVAVEIGSEFTLTDRLDLAVSIGHRRFPIAGTPALDAGAMTVWSLSGNFLIHLLPSSSPIQPYVVAGGGLYRLDHTPERDGVVCLAHWSPAALPCPPPYVTSDDPEVRPGLQGGLGVSVPLTPGLRVFTESTYTGLFSGQENLQYVPIHLGIRYRTAR